MARNLTESTVDPITLIIAAAVSWGVGKSLDATLMRLMRRLTRETCEGFTHLAGHENALLRFAGEIAKQTVGATSDSELQKRVYKLLATQSTELQALRDSLKDDAVWQFDVGQDLNLIQKNLDKALTQMAAVGPEVQKQIKQLPEVLFENLGMPHVHERLDQIHDLLTRGLCEPLLAWQRYWADMRCGIPWNELQRKPDAAYTVITSFVAREKDLDRFGEFLTKENSPILHLYGDMGTGKSRFLHECAARAEQDNWLVKFVDDSSQKIDLDAALKIVGEEIDAAKPDGLLLIWDDWQRGNTDALDYFLQSQTRLNVPGDLPVKRIVSTWPIFRRTIEDHTDRHALPEPFELLPLDPGAPAVVGLLRELGLDKENAKELAKRSEGHPMAMIRGADLLLAGEPLSKLTDKRAILYASYNKWLSVLENGQRYSANTRAYVADLRQVALLGYLFSKQLSFLGNIAGYPEPDKAKGRFELLSRDGFLRLDNNGELYSLPHDLLREHIVRLALTDEDEPLAHYRLRNEEQTKSHLAPFANPMYLFPAYPLLANFGSQTRELRIWFARQSAQWDEKHGSSPKLDRIFAAFCVNLTAAEPEPGIRFDITKLIEQVAVRYKPPDREIDLAWAKALHNATVGEKDPRECERIAAKIGRIAGHHDNDREIDLEWAKALHNATVGEKDPRECERIAGEIGEIAKPHDNDREIDLEWAKALYNATVGEKDPRQRKTIADEIGEIAKPHDNDRKIDLEWAKALMSATVVEKDPRERERIAGEIGEIAKRHDNDREIDLAWAQALMSATVVEKDPRERERIAAKIGRIAKPHDNDRKIDLEWAKALHNATVVEKDPRERERIAGEIGEIAKRHDNDPEIDLEWAKALVNATVVEKDARERERIAGKIGEIAARHEPPDRDIDLWYGRGLWNVRRDQPEADARERIGVSIQEITGRYPGDPDFEELHQRLSDSQRK